MKNILLIGLGRFGRHIAMELSELGHEIMAVDVNEGRVDKVLPYVTNAKIGSLLKELGAKMVISRAERDVQEKFLLRNGADKVIYPEKQVAKWASIRYTDDHILDYMEVDASHAIFEVEVPKEWIGKTVGELDIRRKYDINILAIKNNGELSMAISPDTFFTGNISLLVIGEHKAIKKCFHI